MELRTNPRCPCKRLEIVCVQVMTSSRGHRTLGFRPGDPARANLSRLCPEEGESPQFWYTRIGSPVKRRSCLSIQRGLGKDQSWTRTWRLSGRLSSLRDVTMSTMAQYSSRCSLTINRVDRLWTLRGGGVAPAPAGPGLATSVASLIRPLPQSGRSSRSRPCGGSGGADRCRRPRTLRLGQTGQSPARRRNRRRSRSRRDRT